MAAGYHLTIMAQRTANGDSRIKRATYLSLCYFTPSHNITMDLVCVDFPTGEIRSLGARGH